MMHGQANINRYRNDRKRTAIIHSVTSHTQISCSKQSRQPTVNYFLLSIPLRTRHIKYELYCQSRYRTIFNSVRPLPAFLANFNKLELIVTSANCVYPKNFVSVRSDTMRHNKRTETLSHLKQFSSLSAVNTEKSSVMCRTDLCVSMCVCVHAFVFQKTGLSNGSRYRPSSNKRLVCSNIVISKIPVSPCRG